MLKDTYCNNVNVHDAKRHVSHSQPRIPRSTTSHYRTDPKQRSHPRRLFVPSCACRISDSLYLSREHLDAMSLDTVDIVSTVSRSELAFPTQNRPTERLSICVYYPCKRRKNIPAFGTARLYEAYNYCIQHHLRPMISILRWSAQVATHP